MIRRLFLLFFSFLPLCAGAEMSEEEHNDLRNFLQETIADSDSFTDEFEAEVWLVIQSEKLKRFIDSPEDRLSLLKAIHKEAKAADLDPDMVLALIEVESAFDHFAISRVGAQGLMQVMPFWRKEIGRDDDNLTDPLTNLKYGCRIFQYYLKREKGNLPNALARYNGSYPKLWYAERVFKAYRDRWNSGIEKVTYQP